MESLRFLIDVALILFAAKAFGIIARKIHAPEVVGEIIAGLILSFKNLPYAIRCKSVYRVGTVFVGILFSLVGIIVCVILGVIIVKIWTSVGFTF